MQVKGIHNYTLNFEICEQNIQKNSDNILTNKAQQFMLTNNFNKSLHILKDAASGVQVSDLEQVIF